MSSIAPASTTELAAPPGAGAPRRFQVNLRASGIYLAFAAIVVIFDILTHGLLLTPENVSNLIVQNSYILILAIGMILVIIAGHIDLSAGSVVAVTGAIAAVLMVNHHMSWPLALLITLIAGAAIGAWQGYWVAYFGLPAFIVTLAGMLVFRALTMTVLGNQGIGPFPDQVRTLSTGFLGSVLGNVGLGTLGGADLFTLVIGVRRGARRGRLAVAGPHGQAALRPAGRVGGAVRREDGADGVRGAGRRRAAGPATRTCRGCWSCSRFWSWATAWSPRARSSAGTSTPSAATPRPRCSPG